MIAWLVTASVYCAEAPTRDLREMFFERGYAEQVYYEINAGERDYECLHLDPVLREVESRVIEPTDYPELFLDGGDF